MRRVFLPTIALLGLVFTGCKCKQDCDSQIVAARYIHKYGYDVSKQEMEENGYPGQVITTFRNGVTIAATYENSRLHGPVTYTYPHSQTIESKQVYERGQLVKKTSYNVRGTPIREELFLSPTHSKITTWYTNGTPQRIEEFEQNRLVSGEYYTNHNKLESRIEAGEGVRTMRNDRGQLLARETFEEGSIVMRTEYYDSQSPYMVTHLRNGQLHGTKTQYAPTGEPVAIEHWQNGVPEGLFTYFLNGAKYAETPYKAGRKNGVERHFIDGDKLSEETQWIAGNRHGPSIVYLDGQDRVEWYFENQRVSKDKYDELCEQNEHIMRMSRRSSKDVD